MAKLTRRSLLRNSFGLVAAGTLARPHIANAAATTAAVWWVQGFAQEEDVSFKKIVADYEKTSGNMIDYNIVPYAPMRQKIVSAMTSGVVPDLFQNSALWFSVQTCNGDNCNSIGQIGRITTSGAITEYPVQVEGAGPG
jgi:ABC-type glycerol-3-phosphate transport system substrate-binding protein